MVKRDVAAGMTKLLAVATAASMSCCSSLTQQPPPTADKVVREYARALSDGDFTAAYALMSPAYRRRMSFDTWHSHIAANPQEVGETSRQLSRVRTQAELRALQQRRRDRPLELQKHDGRWYIAAEPIEFYDQTTPRAALRSFIAAFAHKRYDVILRIMPEADKEGVTTETLIKSFGHAARNEMARLLSQLRPSLDNPIEAQDDHATMPYADHRHVQFVRERGRWRIVEPQ